MWLKVIILVVQCLTMISGQIAPKIQPIIASKDLMAGETVRLFCSLAKGSAPVRFEWFFNHDPLLLTPKITSELLSTHTNVLQFETVDSNHAGNYTCLVRNEVGQDSASALIQVKGPRFSTVVVSVTTD